jgi:hypothetical protein
LPIGGLIPEPSTATIEPPVHPEEGRSLGTFPLLRIAALFAVALLTRVAPTLGQSRVAGYLIDSVTKQRISNVEILVAPNRQAVTTGDSGSFVIQGLPAGTSTLFFRRIGYRPRALEITIGTRDTLELEVSMTSVAYVIRDLSITAKRNPFIGASNYIGPEQLQSRGREPIGHFLIGIPGFSIRGPHVVSQRGWGLGKSACRVSLWVDGAPMWGIYDLADYTADRIYSIEIYKGVASTPIEYSATSMTPCGAIVIWTHQPD